MKTTEFLSATGRKRPVRLTEATRAFASESLEQHRYGLDTRKTEAVCLDGTEGFETFGNLEKYDRAVAEIAAKSPVRICPGERISGAATLGAAIGHVVPAKFGGQYVFSSVSHLTIDFRTVLDEGIDGICARANAALDRFRGTAREKFSRSCVNCLDSFYTWHRRYIEALEQLPGYEANLANLRQVPLRPARNFYEAVQSQWFIQLFSRIEQKTGTIISNGRMDQYLYPYYKADKDKGVIDEDKAEELLECVWVSMAQYIDLYLSKAGGAFNEGYAHWEAVTIGGQTPDGRDAVNELTYIFLRSKREFPLNYPDLAARIHTR